jgi:predicted nucleotide-binding protein (sugar kinase/HSP70/actin superfamily)
VGIPRSLLYFCHVPFWKTFLLNLGATVRVSPPTERGDLELAHNLTQSDLCLPVKTFLAHVEHVKNGVDWLMLPRVVSLSPDAYMCPKLLGLRDMVRSVFPRLPPLLDPILNMKRSPARGWDEACTWIGRRLGRTGTEVREARRTAQAAQDEFERRCLTHRFDAALAPWDGVFGEEDPGADGPRVAVIGRPYLVFDHVLNHGLLGMLERHGARIVTHESVPPADKKACGERLAKSVYWQLGRDVVTGAMALADTEAVDGIINLASFGCGQDAFTGALVEDYVTTRTTVPLLTLALDTHTAAAGLETRIEAFMDTIARRERIRRAEGGRRAVKRAPPPPVPGDHDDRTESVHITVPHMGHLHLAFEQVFRDLGVRITIPPRPDEEALALGTRYSPECACLPFKLNLGNMIQALEQGVTDIMVPGGYGPCRYGYYSIIQEQILRRLGYRFRMGRTDDPDSLRDMLRTVGTITGLTSKRSAGRIFLLILYRLALIDRALRYAQWLRPREVEPRATDQALGRALDAIAATRSFTDLWRARRRMRRIFGEVAVDRRRPVLRIGVIGEIFMVLENHANMDLEGRLARLGVEVDRAVWLSDWLNDRFRFRPFRRNQLKWALRNAPPYLCENCGGESVESVAKTVRFARRGFDGIVHVMPFACMPELVVQTILPRVARDFDLPVLTLIFDEHTAAGAVQTRLEAFVDLIRYRRRAGVPPGPVREPAR